MAQNVMNADCKLVTASTLLVGKSVNVSSYMNNHLANPSLINYVPAYSRSSLSTDQSDEELGESEEEFVTDDIPVEEKLTFGNKKCLTLWREFTDAAGTWRTHRFALAEWNNVKLKQLPKYGNKETDEDLMEPFDGVLTKQIIALNLSRVDRCPEFQHYAYTKCVLAKKKLSDINALIAYRYLQYVDVSSNKLTTLKALGNLPFLKILDASYNWLGTILDFKAPFFLTVVNLSYNRIRVMRDISEFWSLTDLNLSHNMIKIIDGVKTLRYLTYLNLGSNRIETIENLDDLRIQFLYLQDNVIKLDENDNTANLHTLRNIRKINLSYNKVSSLKMFEAVENLEHLDIFHNNISKLLDIYYLRNLKYLSQVNLIGNPVTYMKRYTEVAVTHIQNLMILDGDCIDLNDWLEKAASRKNNFIQKAEHSRLMLLVLEQLSPPQLFSWIVPFDTPPLAVITLVGLKGSKRVPIVKKFCAHNKNVVVGIPYRTQAGAKMHNPEHFNMIEEKVFMEMLKSGKFLTYHEYLGSLTGIAHSEFTKAANGILIFYTDLNLALSIKSRFINTIIVLAVCSTDSKHLKNLRATYAVNFADQNALPPVNARTGGEPTESQQKNQEDKPSKSNRPSTILNNLVANVCNVAEETQRHRKSETEKAEKPSPKDEKANVSVPSNNLAPKMETLCESQTDSLDSSKPQSDILANMRLQWASSDGNPSTLSMVIRPANAATYTGELDSRKMIFTDFDEQSKAKLRLPECAIQLKRFATSTQLPAKSKASKEPLGQETQNCPKIREVPTKQRVDHEEDTTSKAQDINTKNESKMKEPPTEHRKSQKIRSSVSARITSKDEQKYFFEEVLRERQELLELHLEMPGLFREILFTDMEKETIEKLQLLVGDIYRYNQTTKAMLNFENDLAMNNITQKKIINCFNEIKKEVSISEKQAAEFTMSQLSPLCENMDCDKSICPPW